MRPSSWRVVRVPVCCGPRGHGSYSSSSEMPPSRDGDGDVSGVFHRAFMRALPISLVGMGMSAVLMLAGLRVLGWACTALTMLQVLRTPSASEFEHAQMVYYVNEAFSRGLSAAVTEEIVDPARAAWSVGMHTGAQGARASMLRFIDVNAPIGTLGIGLGDASRSRLGSAAGGVRVAALEPASPLQSLVHVGWHLVAIDGKPVSADHVEVADRLRTSAASARLLRFATWREDVVLIRQTLAVALPVLLVALLAALNR